MLFNVAVWAWMVWDWRRESVRVARLDELRCNIHFQEYDQGRRQDA